MLNVMRDNLKHLKPILWVVAISMVAYLGAYFSCGRDQAGPTAPWAAKVDGGAVSAQEFLREARQRDQGYRQMLGDQFDQFKSQLQIGRQSIETLVARRIILAEARKLGLGASKEEISRRILEDPSLKGPDGNFIGKERYQQVAARAWEGGASGFERFLADGIVIEKWTQLVSSSAQVPDQELLEAYRSTRDRTEADYVVVAGADQDIDTAVTEEQTREWYDAHRESYLRPEGRKIRFVVVERQQQFSGVEVSDQEIQEYYDEHRDEFSKPDQRRARHILIRFPAEAGPEQVQAARAEAESTLARIKAGESFEELARTVSDDPMSAERGGDLGFFGRGAMAPEFERAVFETPVGQVAPLVQTSYGFHIIEVTGEGTATLDAVDDQIREQLRWRRADEKAEAEARRLREKIPTAAKLDEVAAAEGLRVEERQLRRGERIAGLDTAPERVEAVLALAAGSVADPMPVRQGWAVVAAAEVLPPGVAPLADVQDRLETEIINERARKAAVDVARRALERHGSIEVAAKALGLEVLKSGAVAPGATLSKTGGTSPELGAALFGPQAAAGASGVAPVPAGAVIYHITRRDTFDPAEFEASKEELRRNLLEERRNALVQSILSKLREEHEIQINEELVKQVDG